MPTSSDKAGAVETTRMVTRYANSFHDVPEKAGISGIRWVGYDMGESAMTLPVLCAVARVLGLSLGQLLTKAEGRHRG